MPSLDRNKAIECDNCGKKVVKKHISRHKKSCQNGTLFCPECPTFAAKTTKILDYHRVTKHGRKPKKSFFTCSECKLNFHSFYTLRKHKQSFHKIRKQPAEPVSVEIDLDTIMGDHASQELRDELNSVKHFLVDSESIRGKHKVFNFAVAELNPQLIAAKLRTVFSKLDSAAKINVSLGFVLRNIETGDYRYYYAHENSLIFNTAQILSNEEDLNNIIAKLSVTDFVESATRERPNTKWKFAFSTNVTIFAATLDQIPMGCCNLEMPSCILKNKKIYCLMTNSSRQVYDDGLCLLRAVTFHLTGSHNLEEHTADLFHRYVEQSNIDVAEFQGVTLESVKDIEDLTELNISIYDIELDNEKLIGVLSHRSINKYSKSIKLLRYENHICYTKDINAVFNSFRCDNCNKFFPKLSNLRRHLPVCENLVRNKYPSSAYQLKETVFEKLSKFDIIVPENIRLFDNLAVFDFESICVAETTTDTNSTENTPTTWVGRHEPISVSISSNLIDKPIFICEPEPRKLVEHFVDALQKLAAKSEKDMRMRFKDVSASLCDKITNVSNAMSSDQTEITGNLALRPPGHSIKFLDKKKNVLLDLQKSLEEYISTLPVFGFNSSRYDLNLIKSYLIPILINEKNLEPHVIKKTNQFISLKFGNVQLLDILNFIGGATTLDSFLKAYEASEKKGFFPYEWFDCPSKLDHKGLPSYNAFFNKLRNHNPLEADFNRFEKLLFSGYSKQDALKEMKIFTPPPTGTENYSYLKKIWSSENMSTFKDYLEWYNNKDVVPTLEALQKMMKFYHERQIDMLKLGYTLPNLANIYLHSSTTAKFYPFTKNDKDLLEKIRSDMVGGPSIVFTREAVVGETKIRFTDNLCRTIIGIDASQLYPFSMCQEMPTGLYTRWEMDAELKKFKPLQNRRRRFENMVMDHFRNTRPECTIESIYTTGKQHKIENFNVDGFCGHCDTVFEAMGCFYHGCDCQQKEKVTSEILKRWKKRKNYDAERKEYIIGKGFQVIEIWECCWWKQVKDDKDIRERLKKNFPFRKPLSEQQIMQQIKNNTLFGYVQCDLSVPKPLQNDFKYFSPIFKNCFVSRDDIGEYMKTYAEKHCLLQHPSKMLISSFHLENGSVITPLFNFYLNLGLECTKIHRFVEYFPQKCFKGFVKSVVHARRLGDQNKKSTVIAETMKLLSNSSYGYQIMDRSKDTVTKFLDEKKTNRAINSAFFKQLRYINDSVYEVELVKAQIEHREPIIVGFFILQYAKLRMLELYYNFFQKYCDQNKFEELEMDTDSLYLALAENNIPDCIKQDMVEEWAFIRRGDCINEFEANSLGNFFPRNCCFTHAQLDKREPGLFKEEFRATEMICLCSKTYCCYNSDFMKMKFSSKGLNKHFLSDSSDGPVKKYRKVLDEATNIGSINRGFRARNHAVYTYEQSKKGLSFFYPKRKLLPDGIHTDPLDI